MKVASNVPKNRSLLNFSNILRKSIATAAQNLCFIVMQNIQTLLGSSHVCCYLIFGGCSQKWSWPFDRGTMKSTVFQESE